jgi:hypothetical protein
MNLKGLSIMTALFVCIIFLIRIITMEHQYDIDDLNGGMYLVRVCDDQNQVKVMKFIKR